MAPRRFPWPPGTRHGGRGCPRACPAARVPRSETATSARASASVATWLNSRRSRGSRSLREGPVHGEPSAASSRSMPMTTIHLSQTTTATPGQFVAGLTDFGPGRSELFGNSADGYLKVHDQGPGQADVTEGSRGVWERLHYDWSDPNRIVMTTTDSNVWGGASGHTYTLTRQPNGTTDVDVVVVREGKNLKGRLIAIAVSVIGKQFLGKELGKTIKAIEARNYAGSA